MFISDNHTCINASDLQQFLQAVGSEHEFAQGTLLNKSVSTRWDFAGAFSFVVTVVTTIGEYICLNSLHVLTTTKFWCQFTSKRTHILTSSDTPASRSSNICTVQNTMHKSGFNK